MAWPPAQNDIEIIEQGQVNVYVHATSVNNWPNIDAGNVTVSRIEGFVNALGSGFYTYPKNLVDGNENLFVTFIGWAHLDIEPENADQMREALQVVRIVEIFPTSDVRVWKPPGETGQLHENLTALSNQSQLNFLAITKHSASQETIWLNAKSDDQDILRYPVADGSEFEYLQVVRARPMTQEEINKYVNNVFGQE